MNICMMTNTYLPHVGGVARSVDTFVQEYRRMGHRVFVVAPEFPDMPESETDVVRVPALQNFNGSDFSVRLPIPGFLRRALEDFRMDIVHAHHPFLLGDTALRVASEREVPIVFTHHTLYEQYTHYVPFDSEVLQRFVIEMSTRFANLCDGVIAPSGSLAKLIRERGVEVPIEVVPTGVDLDAFAAGDGAAIRRELGIADDALVIGHVGRLAKEKNLEFLTRAVARCLKRNGEACFLLVGGGSFEERIVEIMREEDVEDRLYRAGKRMGTELANAYSAMDVFAFSSKSETQGVVLVEAMAAGSPVVALDASGARDVLEDGKNGRLLAADAGEGEFAEALSELVQDSERCEQLRRGAAETVREYSREATSKRALAFYERTIAEDARSRKDLPENTYFAKLLRQIETEWNLLAGRAESARAVITRTDEPRTK